MLFAGVQGNPVLEGPVKFPSSVSGYVQQVDLLSHQRARIML